MTPVRWGIVSTANINRRVLPEVQPLDEVEILAVGSRSAAAADAFAAERGIPRAYGTYEELLADPDVEAVYIPLPNGLHVEWTLRALAAGKHVLCEKPLDRRPAEVERAFDAAAQAGLILMEAFMWRHHPQTVRAVELVEAGAIGELRAIRASFGFTLGDAGDVRAQPHLDGGGLMDVGCYCISAARRFAGEPELAIGRQVLGLAGVDVRFAALLVFAGPVFGHFDCGFDVPPDSGVEVVGSAGTLHLHTPFLITEPGIELDRDGGVERIEIEPAGSYALQFQNMSAAIRGQAEPLLGRDDALGQARTIDALYRSAQRGGEPVALTPLD
jgi:D-xylose 1-dehydrogenase (NADP+, D-xylono-1,5-lactone-forming)